MVGLRLRSKDPLVDYRQHSSNLFGAGSRKKSKTLLLPREKIED